ncbi:signal peptidase II [candidate division bacterium WOR-3 4484_18]|uniref:Lipoprotein signal peptidase n=1 Tax=candidate division WOR-3 bacterium 4484_18 TaxID=2020626 RepID=A0A257LUV8_UNCW3|nr:MAG: signal peptidase II [candidate division bacterium WOR-3 4484_18]
MRGRWRWWIVLVGVVGVDQLTKQLVVRWLVPYRPVRVVGDFIRLQYVHNPYAVFGVKMPGVLLIPVMVVVIGVILYFWVIRNFHWESTLIIGGAIGNLIDRIMYKGVGVVDFIDIGVSRWRWPTFNVADTAVVIGMVVLGVKIVFGGKKHSP